MEFWRGGYGAERAAGSRGTDFVSPRGERSELSVCRGYLMRKRWRPPSFFGPLFGYDLIASTRRGQHTGLRVLVGVALLFTLYVVYSLKVRGFDPFANPFAPGPRVDPKDMADFASAFATWCLIVQFVAVILITPIVVADAIAREKERRALDFLFVTALTDWEIVLGKLGSRLAYMTSVVLTGLPILTLTQLFGGVDPNLLLSGYAALLATLVSLGALSLYCSVVSSTALQATVRSYAAATGYLMVCPCLLYPLLTSDMAITGLIVYVAANLGFAWILVLVSVHDLRPRAELLPPAPVPTEKLPPHSNRRRMRPVVTELQTEIDDDALPFVLPTESARVAGIPDPPVAVRGWDPVEWRHLDRPTIWEPPELPRLPLQPIGERQPLLWKEVYLHSLIGSAPGGPVAAGVLLMVAAVPTAFIWMAVAIGTNSDLVGLSTGVVKVGTVVLGSLLALGAMIHSVNSVTREREKDTLDGLLILPVTRDEILSAKWLGGLSSLRLVAIALAILWIFGVVTGGLHPVAFVALALSVAAVIEFLTSLGLWLSIVSKTSLRANLAAVLCVLLVAAGPFVASEYIDLLAPYSGVNRAASDVVWRTLMPAMAWLQLCKSWPEYAKLPEEHFTTILAGALGYAVAAWLLWRAALGRFRRYGGKRT
jgi:ABC-type transport system involved in multi-copper enzyme maturation permease subunit